MTTTETTTEATRRRGRGAETATGTQPSAAPVLPPTKTRRRPMLIAAGIAIAIIGGLGSYYLYTAGSSTVTVLVTSTDIARGAELTTNALTTIEIAGGQNTTAYRASQSTDVIGDVALVDLPAGTLLTTSNVGDGLPIADGQSIVGVALTPQQMPSYPLAAGDRVRLVDTPIAQGDPPATTPQTFRATIFTTRYDAENRVYIVDLVVPSGQAADIAARAATGRVALVVDATAGE